MAYIPGAGELGGPGLPGRVRIGEAQLTSHAIMEQDRFGRFISDLERSRHDLLEKLIEKMEARARRYAPVRTGRLSRSIQSVVLMNGREARVFTNVPYAGVMEAGSRPHLIHGVRKNFKWKGGYFRWNDPRYGPTDMPQTETHRRGYMNWSLAYGATVRHPGTKPHRFMARAFHETWAEARFVMREAYNR
jgi:hypothetical protein